MSKTIIYSMKQEEINMWRMIDVGGYNASIGIFWDNLFNIQKGITSGEPEDIPRRWKQLNDRFEGFSERFEDMQLERLNSKYPLAIMMELKNELVPKLTEELGALDALIDFCEKHKEKNLYKRLPHTLVSAIDRCAEPLKKMFQLGKPFQAWPGYDDYRKSKTQRIYSFKHSTPEARAV